MSPRLLRRLAEAALGAARSGKKYWVGRYERNADLKYELHGYPSRPEATDQVKDPQKEGVFGPFELTAAELAKLPPVRIASVTVEVPGIAEPLSIPVDRFDGIFWGYPAIEKFVLPYYVAADGLEVATKLNDEYLTGKPDAYLLAHSNDTEYQIHRLEPTRDGKALILTPIL